MPMSIDLLLFVMLVGVTLRRCPLSPPRLSKVTQVPAGPLRGRVAWSEH